MGISNTLFNELAFTIISSEKDIARFDQALSPSCEPSLFFGCLLVFVIMFIVCQRLVSVDECHAKVTSNVVCVESAD